MNNQQPGTSTANIFFDALLISHALPDTFAKAIPETTPDVVEMLAAQDTVALPALRLPQIAPSQVIAMRQRSIPPILYSQSREAMPPHSDKMKQKPMQATPKMLQTPQPLSAYNTPVTPLPDDAAYRNASKLTGITGITGITYIPRSMTRHAQPTVVDTLIACGTLILLCFCVLLFLYYVGL